MDNIIKYVRNRTPNLSGGGSGGAAQSGDTPYVNLEDTVSVNKASASIAAGAESGSNYSTLPKDDDGAQRNDDSGIKTTLDFFIFSHSYPIVLIENLLSQ